MQELLEWLEANKIRFSVVEDDVLDIPGFGRALFQDMERINSIFRMSNEGELIFNSMEDPGVLLNDEITYIIFKFGNNWYYQDIRKDFDAQILKYIGERVSCTHDIPFVNLGIHTPFELLNGSFMPAMWIKKAMYLGQSAIGVCDYNTMASLFCLQKECKSAGITHIFGYSLTFTDDDQRVGAKVYVQTQRGLQNLLRIQKAIMVDSEDQTISMERLLSHGNGNIIVFDKYSSKYLHENPEVVTMFRKSFEDIYYQVDLSEYKAERIDLRVLEATKYYFDNLYGAIDPILISDCYYLDKDDAKNKLLLNKVATGAAHEQSDDQYFKDLDEHYEVFEKTFDPARWDTEALFKECCKGTVRIADGAKAEFETNRNFMPKYDMTPEEKSKYGTTHNMFCHLLEEGLQALVPPHKQEQYRKQMEYEKYIIESTNNVDYLLVQYDTVNWCKRNGIQVGCGRGSAAGCLLLYLLGITLIDPIKYELIFERFLLPERAGLYQSDTTIIGEDIETTSYVQVSLENKQTISLDKDARLLVKRTGIESPIEIYADQLSVGDDILFDNKDELFTLNEINNDNHQ